MNKCEYCEKMQKLAFDNLPGTRIENLRKLLTAVEGIAKDLECDRENCQSIIRIRKELDNPDQPPIIDLKNYEK